MARTIGFWAGARPDWCGRAAGWIAAQCVEHGHGEPVAIYRDDRPGDEWATHWPRMASEWEVFLQGMAPGTEVRVVPHAEPGTTIVLRRP